MDYEPENEQGVVCLFALLYGDLGFKSIERIQTGFPDCVARRRVRGGDESVNIEFEYESRQFVSHRHLSQMKSRGVKRVTIICWEDNWLDPPKNIEIVSLKQLLGLRRVWVMSSRENEPYTRFFDRRERSTDWSLPDRAQRGDLILIYRTATRTMPGRIEDVVQITKKNNQPDPDWGAYGRIRKVTKLRTPLVLEDFRDHYSLSKSPLSSSAFYQGRRDITEYWPDVYRLMIKKNRASGKQLKDFHPRLI